MDPPKGLKELKKRGAMCTYKPRTKSLAEDLFHLRT